jgi:hypothetical protein
MPPDHSTTPAPPARESDSLIISFVFSSFI